MKWSYKTVHFELKKEGLLGSGFLDESEIEQELNEFGLAGWELVSVLEVQDGIIVFFKQPIYPENSHTAEHLRTIMSEKEEGHHVVAQLDDLAAEEGTREPVDELAAEEGTIESVDELAAEDVAAEQFDDSEPDDHEPSSGDAAVEEASEDGSTMGAIKIE
jgi:hypothetical protein